MGYGGDASVYYTSPALLANINGVDAIIDGHTHLEYNNTFPDKDGKQIHISQTGTKLNKVGKITIKIDGTITSELIGEIPLFEGYDNCVQSILSILSYEILYNFDAKRIKVKI